MRERVHIKYTYIYLCSCNSYTCQTGKEFGFPWSVRWRKILLCFKGGVLNYALECRLDGVQNHSRSRPYLCTRAFSDGISWPSPLLHGREDFWVIIHFCCWVGILRVCFQVDIVLHIPLLCGDVPDGTSSGTGTRGRENGHTQDTNEISITDWKLVQGNLERNRWETWEDIGLVCLASLTIGSFWLV